MVGRTHCRSLDQSKHLPPPLHETACCLPPLIPAELQVGSADRSHPRMLVGVILFVLSCHGAPLPSKFRPRASQEVGSPVLWHAEHHGSRVKRQ